MTLFWTASLIGTLIYYFLARAFKVDFFTLEILVHNMSHFFSGFIAFSLLVYFQAKYRVRILSVIAVIVIVVGLIITNERNVDSDGTDLTMVVYNAFLFFWGAIIGLILANKAKLRKTRKLNKGKTSPSNNL